MKHPWDYAVSESIGKGDLFTTKIFITGQRLSANIHLYLKLHCSGPAEEVFAPFLSNDQVLPKKI